MITGLSWFDQIAQQYSISNLREVDISCQISRNFYHITFEQSYTVDQVCDAFTQETEVVQAWPVMIPEWFATPDDPSYGNQWGLVQIDAAGAWDYESGNSSVIVGILDTGTEVEYDADPTEPIHPDLEDNLWNNNGLYGIDLIHPGTAPDDGFGHGTHVAGIAGAVTNNNTGVAGLAGGGFGSDDGVTLLVVRNGDDDGASSEEYFAESICQALNPDGDWNTDDWVDIINMSWGLRLPVSAPPDGYPFPILMAAVDEAYDRNVVMIAAVGNRYIDFTKWMNGDARYWPYPAGYNEVIAVAATGIDDDQASYSNEGSFIDVAAPGGSGFPFDNDDILSTTPRDPFYLNTLFGIGLEYGYIYGTSMAAPYVSGLAGLILSRFPSYTPDQVRNLLGQSAEKVGQYSYDGNGWNKYLGYGRINAFYAVAPPATPQGFTVTGNAGDNPFMYWTANTEPDLEGYHLYKDEGYRWFLMTTVDKYTTSYTDYSVIIGQGGKFTTPSVCYRIASFDITDQESAQSFPRCKPLFGVSKASVYDESEPTPEKFALLPAYPNPFNPVATISYQLPYRSIVTLRIYSVTGQNVRTLVSTENDAGYYVSRWDGIDDRGRMVSSGTYIIQLIATPLDGEPSFTGVMKVLFLR